VTIPGDLAQDGGRGKMGLGALAPISLTRLPLKLLGAQIFLEPLKGPHHVASRHHREQP
jgi:hypothetical protein